jgi:hypothetical protein
VSNSLTPCSMMLRDESSHPTFILALCSRLLGFSKLAQKVKLLCHYFKIKMAIFSAQHKLELDKTQEIILKIISDMGYKVYE